MAKIFGIPMIEFIFIGSYGGGGSYGGRGGSYGQLLSLKEKKIFLILFRKFVEFENETNIYYK